MSSRKPPSQRKGSISPGRRITLSPSPPWSSGPPQRSAAIRANALLRESESPRIIPSDVGPKGTKKAPKRTKRPADSSVSSDEEKSLDDSESDPIPPSPTPDSPTLSPELLTRLGKFLDHHQHSIKSPKAKRPRKDNNTSSSSSPSPVSQSIGKSNAIVASPSPTHVTIQHSNISVGSSTPPSSPPQGAADSPPTIPSILSPPPINHWRLLAEAPNFSRIFKHLSLSESQIRKAKENQFVPLAYFLPLSNSEGVPSMPSQSVESSQSFELRCLLTQLTANNPNDQLKRQKDEFKNAPRFRRWDQVVLAFIGGLMPMMCAGRPDRLSDYGAFIIAVIAECSRLNGSNWPVFLKYIEQTRRDALLIDGEHNPNVKSLRANHSLVATSSPDKTLNSQLLHAIKIEWTESDNSSFIEEFVDPDVLRPLKGHPHAVATSSAGDPPTSRPPIKKETLSSAFAPPQLPSNISADQWHRMCSTFELKDKFCRSFLLGICKGKCRNGRPHLDAEAVKQLL